MFSLCHCRSFEQVLMRLKSGHQQGVQTLRQKLRRCFIDYFRSGMTKIKRYARRKRQETWQCIPAIPPTFTGSLNLQNSGKRESAC